jgi:hypothetical protein
MESLEMKSRTDQAPFARLYPSQRELAEAGYLS